MFTKYTKPITDIIKKYGNAYHIYADDTQLYTVFDVEDFEEAVQNVEKCIVEIRAWMSYHWLKLNDSKTEVRPKRDLWLKCQTKKGSSADIFPS